MNNKWKSLLFFSPAVCVAVFAAFGLLCNQPIFPSLSGNDPAGNLEKVADAKEKKQNDVKKITTKGAAGWRIYRKCKRLRWFDCCEGANP